MLKRLLLVVVLATTTTVVARANDSPQYEVEVIIECKAPKENPNQCLEQMLQYLLNALADMKNNHEQLKQVQPPVNGFSIIKKIE